MAFIVRGSRIDIAAEAARRRAIAQTTCTISRGVIQEHSTRSTRVSQTGPFVGDTRPAKSSRAKPKAVCGPDFHVSGLGPGRERNGMSNSAA